MREKIILFFRQKRWRQWKKGDWVVLALTGVLLMIIAMPMEERKQEKKADLIENKEQNIQKEYNTTQKEDYSSYLERKLEKVLSQIDGVGKVEVMVTVSDYGSYVVEKDILRDNTTTSENDSTGGNRTVTESQTQENTIYIENGQEKTPYIQRENLPTIEGVVVVAEGGENGKIVSEISETIEALFQVKAHRIKVVKMGSKEGKP